MCGKLELKHDPSADILNILWTDFSFEWCNDIIWKRREWIFGLGRYISVDSLPHTSFSLFPSAYRSPSHFSPFSSAKIVNLAPHIYLGSSHLHSLQLPLLSWYCLSSPRFFYPAFLSSLLISSPPPVSPCVSSPPVLSPLLLDMNSLSSQLSSPHSSPLLPR